MEDAIKYILVDMDEYLTAKSVAETTESVNFSTYRPNQAGWYCFE